MGPAVGAHTALALELEKFRVTVASFFVCISHNLLHATIVQMRAWGKQLCSASPASSFALIFSPFPLCFSCVVPQISSLRSAESGEVSKRVLSVF